MTFLTIHWAGKYPRLIIVLHMIVRWTVPSLDILFSIVLVIMAYLGTFLGLRLSYVIFWISCGVKNSINCAVYSGSFSVFLISVLKILFCGSSLVLMNVFS
jgi:hypothetical protein